MRLMAHNEYVTGLSKVDEPSSLQKFERGMAGKYGPEFRARMSAVDKLQYARLLDVRPNAEVLTEREQAWKDLERLRSSASESDSGNVQLERIRRINVLEAKLAGKS
jgi:hypothetical protein